MSTKPEKRSIDNTEVGGWDVVRKRGNRYRGKGKRNKRENNLSIKLVNL